MKLNETSTDSNVEDHVLANSSSAHPIIFPQFVRSLQSTLTHGKTCLTIRIQAIIQMRRQDQVTMETDIVPNMAISGDLASWNCSERLTVVRVSKEDNRVDEIGGGG